MRILISGFGVVGRAFARLLESQRAALYADHGLSPSIVGVIDSKGAALAPEGLDVAALLEAKEKQGSVATLPHHGIDGAPGVDLIEESDAQLLVEATPTSVKSPAPALERLKAAFRTGKHVVCVNKGPLAVAFPALRELSRHNRAQLRFSGTVGGGTPVLALAAECARGDAVLSVRAILNGTTNFILWRMDQDGLDFEAALAEAVKLGYAETDPSADIDGIDTATKLVILANGVLGRSCTLADVKISGIRGLPRARIEAARKSGRVVKLIAEIGDTTKPQRDPDHSATETPERNSSEGSPPSPPEGNPPASVRSVSPWLSGASVALKVEPQEVAADSPLNVPANLNCLGLKLQTGGDVALVGRGAGGPETATAILRDLVDIWHTIGSAR
jgi:homoserine dehydrogenase